MQDLIYEIYIADKPEQVWRAITEDDGVRAAFFGTALEASLHAGGEYAYVGPGNDGNKTVHVYGTILEIEPYRLLRMTEHAGPSYRSDHAELETRVTYALEPAGGTTKLTLVNDRWPDNHPSYDNARGSWPMTLSAIKTYVETGRTLDFGW